MSADVLSSALSSLEDPQAGNLLLRHCHVPRLNYLARSVPQATFQSAAQIHDDMTRNTFLNILGVSSLSEDTWNQASLPIKMGGFGLTSTMRIAPAAFLAGWSHSIAELPIRFPYLSDAVTSLLSPGTCQPLICDSINQAIKSLNGKFDSQQLLDLLDHPHKLQNKISSIIHKRDAHICLETATQTSDRDAARIRSTQGQGAGSWLEAIPTEEALALKPNEFRLAASLRLGIPPPFVDWNIQCECGRPVDDYHLITCKFGGGPVWQHDEIVNAWSSCLHELKIHHDKEPRHRYSGNDNRPDIVMYDSGSSYDLDVALAHPFSSDALRKASQEGGSAAARREERKRVKYQAQVLLDTSSLSFTPLVFEHFGRWGTTAMDFLNSLARKSRDVGETKERSGL